MVPSAVAISYINFLTVPFVGRPLMGCTCSLRVSLISFVGMDSYDIFSFNAWTCWSVVPTPSSWYYSITVALPLFVDSYYYYQHGL